MGHRIVPSTNGTPWPPDGERAGDVNIRVDLPEAGGDRGAHPPDIDPPIIPKRMRLTREIFERFGLIRTGLGTQQTTLSAVAKGMSKNSRRSLKIARSLKEMARQALVMVLEMSHHHAQLNRVSVLTSLRENRAMMRTWRS